jgi:ketosteroid isomerase-like protein
MTRIDNPKTSQQFAEAPQQLSDADEIRALIDRRLQAIRARDVQASTSAISSEYVLFDVVEPLRTTGALAASSRAEEWFATFQGPIAYDILDLEITAGNGVGFSHGLNHVRGTKLDGNILDMWWRATVGYKKIDGEWRITHEHNSVPFNVANGKASLSLQP